MVQIERLHLIAKSWLSPLRFTLNTVPYPPELRNMDNTGATITITRDSIEKEKM